MIRVPGQRRELARYGRYALTHPTAAMAALVDGLLFRRPRRGCPPDGLTRPGETLAGDGGGREGRLPLFLPYSDGAPPTRLPLATCSWDLSQGPPWLGQLEDPEDRFAAHRFGWVPTLLRAHGVGARDLLAGLAEQWIANHTLAPGAPGCDSYSVAERIVHWTYLTTLEGDSRRSRAIGASVQAHAGLLDQHLELRGEATNNHLINDGRALYHAAVQSGDEALQSRARALVDYGAERMFVSGFLREGSSHYHLLLSRTFLELWVLARAVEDTAWAEALGAQVESMLGAAAFLAMPSGLPLFGDVSPDVEPSALVSLTSLAGPASMPTGVPTAPDAARLDGWAGLLIGEQDVVPAGPVHASYPEAGYHKATAGAWTLSSYVNPLGHVAPWSHAHADLGSFVLDWHQSPVLVDAGRATYRASPLGDYGRSVRSHNSVSIDRHEPCVAHGLNGFVPVLARAYYHRRPRVAIDTDPVRTTLRVEHDGFGRLGDGLSVARTVALEPHRCVVTDAIEGVGRRAVETFFHFHPDVAVAFDEPTVARCDLPDGARLHLRVPDDVTCRLARGQIDPEPSGWYAGRYGRAEPCWTLTCHTRATLPRRQHYELVAV